MSQRCQYMVWDHESRTTVPCGCETETVIDTGKVTVAVCDEHKHFVAGAIAWTAGKVVTTSQGDMHIKSVKALFPKQRKPKGNPKLAPRSCECEALKARVEDLENTLHEVLMKYRGDIRPYLQYLKPTEEVA